MGALFGGSPQVAAAPPPAAPVLETPAAMPVPDKEDEKRNALRTMALAKANKTDRASTIIGDEDNLG